MKLTDALDKIPGIGPKSETKLEKLGIFTIKDLLFHFPNYHHDFSEIVSLSSLNYDRLQTIKVIVSKISNVRLKGKSVKSMQKAKVYDDSAEIDVVWFNQPYIVEVLNEGDEVYLAAKLNPKSFKPQIGNPEYEIVKEKNTDTTHIARITPIYSLTEGIKQKWLRSKLKWLIDKIEFITDFEETLPNEILEKYSLCSLNVAIKNIHFPENHTNLEKAKERLAFEEMFNIQIRLEEIRAKNSKYVGPKFDMSSIKTTQKLISSFPFKLTQDQENAIEDILEDFKKKKPMRRLLNGDVGSGKTVVAIASALEAIESGYDVALMAPTTVLVNQLYKTFTQYLKPFHIDIELLTSNTKTSSLSVSKSRVDKTKKDTISTQPSLNKPDRKKYGKIIIGTHSLLYQKENLFSNLGILIIDEQHRFGVEQRNKLMSLFDSETSNFKPHYLMMTATPIPRTIAMTFFGDMDLSLIQEKPQNRKETKTFLVPAKKRNDGYKWIEKEVEKGNQVFWICPLIEESDKLQTKSVKETFKYLQEIYPDLRIELLHGQMKDEEKNILLTDFKDAKFDILVSTSVIEVGIDIPNANYIVIEGAERFGLAQLHQLRGRVGRGEQQAYCFLFHSDGSASDVSTERLKYFSKENNGLKIAEFDLKQRGPGEVYGTKQSGVPDLKIAKLSDTELIKKTREAASIMVSNF